MPRSRSVQDRRDVAFRRRRAGHLEVATGGRNLCDAPAAQLANLGAHPTRPSLQYRAVPDPLVENLADLRLQRG